MGEGGLGMGMAELREKVGKDFGRLRADKEVLKEAARGIEGARGEVTLRLGEGGLREKAWKGTLEGCGPRRKC